jgi:cell division protein FtsQ
VQQGVPLGGRAIADMPQEMPVPDGNDGARSDWERPDGVRPGGQRPGPSRREWPSQDWPRGPWWRPASTLGRVFLGLGALIVLGALATGVLLLKTYLERDARFRIAGAGNIQASGLTEVSRAEMLPIFGEDIGRNVFFVPLSERRKQLEAIPWVERASVMRLLPDQIRVSLVERQPVAFTRQGQQVGLVDASGVLLTMPAATMAQHHYSFPVVTGIDPRDPVPSRRVRMAVYQRLLAELDANGQHLSEQISEIDLTNSEDARVLMPEQGEDILAHFGDDRFLERYQRYKAHIAEWRQQYPKLAAVDLRYDQQVVLEMTHGTKAVQAAVGGDGEIAASKAKPSAAEPAETAPAEPKPSSLNDGKAPHSASAKSQSNLKQAKPKTTAAKDRAAKDKAAKAMKKRAEAKRAALNASKRKLAHITRPATVTRQGQ